MPRLLIASPNRDAYSETFIRAHIDRLGEVVTVLTDGAPPTRDASGQPLVPMSTSARLVRKLTRTTHGAALEKAIAQRMRKDRVEVVLAEYGTSGEALLPVCRSLGVPLVVHFHGIDAFHDDLLRKHRKYAATFAGAAAVVVVSREMEAQLLALGCPREKLHYNCYGIDVAQFGAVDPGAADEHFIAVGRFVDKKAPHLTVLAFHKAWSQDPAMRLTYIGDGPLQESTVRLARALGLQDAITFTGALTHKEVADHMARARAFVQHSVISFRNDHEGTPLSILEAMSRALPVVSTRHGGINDVVEHGASGYLCAEGDVDAMASHLLELAAAPDRARSMGLRGRARVEAEHTLQGSISALRSIIHRAAGRG